MRPIWTGGISFGLIYIPVSMYSAVEQKADIDFDLLDKVTMSRIHYQKVAESTGKEVDSADIVKAFQYEKGKYVVVDEDEFEKATLDRSKKIDVAEFVLREEIDLGLYERPYFLEPTEESAKIYKLLTKALSDSAKVGIAQFVMRNREHLCALYPAGDALILNTLRFADEVRNPDKLKLPGGEAINKEELQMAREIIAKMTHEFKIEKYKDTYDEVLQKLIAEKMKHKKIVTKSEAPKATEVKDLMAMLKKSLEVA